MKDYKKEKSFRRDGGDRSFGGHASMHQAVCSSCGKNCEVPFRPTGDKPVYCSDCFKNVRPDGFRSRDDRGGSSFHDKTMYKVVCSSCGKNCEVPFRPTGGKPVFCSDCFSKESKPAPRGGDDQVKNQLAALNSKLDQILQVLVPSTKKSEPVKKLDEVKPSKKQVVKPAKKAPAKKPAAKVKKSKKK